MKTKNIKIEMPNKTMKEKNSLLVKRLVRSNNFNHKIKERLKINFLDLPLKEKLWKIITERGKKC
jgi:hypothetical protein